MTLVGPTELKILISQVLRILTERYERGGVLLTSNLPFSKWEGVFKDPMTTAAAIDRLVHHSIIAALNIPGFRLEEAKSNVQSPGAETDQPPPPAAGSPTTQFKTLDAEQAIDNSSATCARNCRNASI